MTTRADPPPGAISYAEWLRRQVEDRLKGQQTICGPPIADWPSSWERLWPWARPDHAVERELERRLDELDRELEL